MDNKEFIKGGLDEISSHEIDIIAYLMNNFMTKKSLYYDKGTKIKEIDKLQQKYDKALELLQENSLVCENDTTFAYLDCDKFSNEECQKCWDRYIEQELDKGVE